MAMSAETQDKIAKYFSRAQQAVETGRLVMNHEDYITAVNRAYYAIFICSQCFALYKRAGA